jgi:beta-lactamase regulating signal transducer with metallopeptidase domain
MESVISYIARAFIVSGIMYCYYLLVLRNKKFHAYNRFYLLVTIFLSLLAPFVHFSWYHVNIPHDAPLNNLITIVAGPNEVKPAAPFTVGTVALGISAFVSVSLLTLLFAKIRWIYRLKRSETSIRMDGFNFIETTARQTPFSFLNNLFWKKGMSATDGNGKKILEHELAHIRQRHTYDKLIAQLTLCIFWMNPFYWLIQKELNIIHEFLADAVSVEEGDSESFALMLLQSYNGGSHLFPSHSFFNSSIKRRLTMITSSHKTPYSYLRRAAVLPLAVFLLSLSSFTLSAQTDKKVDHVEVQGETGKGDTGIVYFKDGSKEKYILNNPAENKVFKQKYARFLSHPQRPSNEPKHIDQPTSIQYEPLNPIPSNISEITFGSETISLKLDNGAKEQYDLTNEEEKKSFESKYGKLKMKKEI